MTTSLGTPFYQAPELIDGLPYDIGVIFSIKVDIWAIGVMYFEMLFGYNFFHEKNNPGNLRLNIKRKKFELSK